MASNKMECEPEEADLPQRKRLEAEMQVCWKLNSGIKVQDQNNCRTFHPWLHAYVWIWLHRQVCRWHPRARTYHWQWGDWQQSGGWALSCLVRWIEPAGTRRSMLTSGRNKQSHVISSLLMACLRNMSPASSSWGWTSHSTCLGQWVPLAWSTRLIWASSLQLRVSWPTVSQCGMEIALLQTSRHCRGWWKPPEASQGLYFPPSRGCP